MIRRVLAVRGQMRFVVDVAPRFDYARARHEVALTPHGALFRSPELGLSLSTRCPLEIVDGGDVRARIDLRAGETATFVLDRVEPGELPVPYSDADIAAEFDATVAFWRRWLGRSRYSGRWREMVHRSALTLKLLTYAPTGAIVAAPTTSLPEQLGGARNWDYRYTWIRDAAFTLYALLRLGFTEEAGAFMEWLEGRFRHAADRESGPLQIMYGIDGREDLPEEELWHLEGYMGSAPVRIGNGAATQLQLDIYGELMDSVYLCNKYGRPIYHDGWMELTRNLEWLIDHWDQPDEGIWRDARRPPRLHLLPADELGRGRARDPDRPPARPARRPPPLDGGPGPHLQPDHGARLAPRAPGVRPALRHRRARRLPAAHAPVQVHRAPPTRAGSPPLDAITAELVSDSLVYRYNVDASPDGLAGEEATFSLCSFWWVEASPGPGGRRGAAGLREDAHLRQPPRPVLGGDRPDRRAARQLPPGLHAPGADQRRLQPGPPARVSPPEASASTSGPQQRHSHRRWNGRGVRSSPLVLTMSGPNSASNRMEPHDDNRRLADG